MSYVEWGRHDAERTVVCAHGFSRNGRDFDALARRLGSRWRVICPDLPGRGGSSWLAVDSNDAGYNLGQYLLDVIALIDRLDVDQIDWVGTSMGALIGMLLAAQPDTPIRRLVMNDTGPLVPGAFLDQMATYITKDPDFDTLDDLEAYLRRTYPGFGALTDDEWRHLARHSERRKPNGTIGLAYDPAIGKVLRPPHPDQDLWAIWATVRCPVLVLRGENSTALPLEVAQKMTTTGPKATLRHISGCGHAPALMNREQIALVETWLDQGP